MQKPKFFVSSNRFEKIAMADNTVKYLKYTRLIALAHIIGGALLLIFGIVDRAHGYFWSGEGCFGIWCGIWMCVTGGLGIPATNRERNSTSNCMAGAFMGFAITSAVFGGVIIICYSISIALYHYWHYDNYYGNYYYDDYPSEMAITVIILILGIVEFAIGIWAAVLSCVVTKCNCCATGSAQAASVVYVTGQGAVQGGYIMGQGPGGVPVAFPIQQAGGVVTVPGAHPQMVHVPPSGVVHVAGQPQMYQVSTPGAQMVQVPTSGTQMVQASGAEGGNPQLVHGAPGAEWGQSQLVRVTPGEPVTGAQGSQEVQLPPPYNPDEQLPVKT